MHESFDTAQLITARFILPVARPPLEQGALVMRAGRIERVCSEENLPSFYSENELNALKKTAVNYGNAILTPGLINLHTHLDYSSLHELFADDKLSMFEWLPRLVQTSWAWSPAQWKDSAIYGAMQSLHAGTTTIVDNSFTGQSAKILAHIGLRAVVGLELFGQDERLAESAWERWLEKYERVANDPDVELQKALTSGLIKLTVAPHSPYTVAPALWKFASAWAEQHNRQVLAHVAESVEECAWIAEHNASLDGYLRWMRELQAKAGIIAYDSVEAPPTPWRGKQKTPCQLLNEHELLNARLVATHMVQVSDEDLALLKTHDVKVVHCARSNMRLKHGLAPLERFREAGLTVGLGTDSLASAPDLSMLEEARAVRQLHSAKADPCAVTPAEALSLVTLDAAKLLGSADKIGSLEEGKFADIAVFQYGKIPLSNLDPIERLFGEAADFVTVYVQGRRLAGA